MHARSRGRHVRLYNAVCGLRRQRIVASPAMRMFHAPAGDRRAGRPTAPPAMPCARIRAVLSGAPPSCRLPSSLRRVNPTLRLRSLCVQVLDCDPARGGRAGAGGGGAGARGGRDPFDEQKEALVGSLFRLLLATAGPGNVPDVSHALAALEADAGGAASPLPPLIRRSMHRRACPSRGTKSYHGLHCHRRPACPGARPDVSHMPWCRGTGRQAHALPGAQGMHLPYPTLPYPALNRRLPAPGAHTSDEALDEAALAGHYPTYPTLHAAVKGGLPAPGAYASDEALDEAALAVAEEAATRAEAAAAAAAGFLPLAGAAAAAAALAADARASCPAAPGAPPGHQPSGPGAGGVAAPWRHRRSVNLFGLARAARAALEGAGHRLGAALPRVSDRLLFAAADGLPGADWAIMAAKRALSGLAAEQRYWIGPLRGVRVDALDLAAERWVAGAARRPDPDPDPGSPGLQPGTQSCPSSAADAPAGCQA
jgi:hypothetical protein